MPIARIRDDYKSLNGADKAAIMLLTLGEDRAAPIMERMEENEVRAVSRAMAGLGAITADLLEHLITQFTEQFAKGGSVVGSVETAERMLKSFLPSEKVADIINYIRGPGGRSTWEKMSMVSETLLAKYLQGEHPQVIAVVLSKVAPEQAARVLQDLPDDIVPDVLERMITIRSVPKEVLTDIEEMLQRDLMMNYQVANGPTSYEQIAEIFNRTGTERSEQLLSSLGDRFPEEVSQIRQLMFTFDDLLNLDPRSLSAVVRACDTDTLVYALKGCGPDVIKKFGEQMSERARGILLDSIETVGPVLMRDVEAAKSSIVRKAKELAEAELIYVQVGPYQEMQMVY